MRNDADSTEALAVALGRSLLARRWQVAVAESCTGGLVAGAITAIAGSSDWFERGFVTYSDEAKQDMLGVPPELIEAHGAVSEPVAKAMVEGAVAQSGARCAVSVTGVAGPGGGSPAKPVGFVCFGWLAPDRPIRVATRRFSGGRAAVRAAAVDAALAGLIDLVESQAAT
jgi:nicotinamide-nucleotide amidase